MKVIVTGKNGFISHYFKNHSKLNIEQINVRGEAWKETRFDASVVVHLAALVHCMKKAPPKEEYFKVNTQKSIELAKKAKKEGVQHFIFMSTAKVYGESSGASGWDEQSQPNPEDDYSLSKHEAEKALKKIEDDNFKIAIIRTPVVYGPHVKGNILKLMQLINKMYVLPFKNIRNNRSMVFIGNLTALIERIIEKKASGIYIARDKEDISTTYLITKIKKYINPQLINFALPSIAQRMIKLLLPGTYKRLYGNFILDATQTNKYLNFIPPFSFDEGIKNMIENTYQ
jgi:UDP-glucose 4-epimerase